MAIKKKFTSFQDMLASTSKPILVDFYATWCGPCHLMAKHLETVGAQLQDRLQMVKLDTERYPQLAAKFQVTALPTLVLFKNGQPVTRLEGVVQPTQLVEFLTQYL